MDRKRCLAAILLLQPFICHAQSVHRWGVFEVSIESSQRHFGQQQYVDVQFELTDPEGSKHIQPGFWHGGKT